MVSHLLAYYAELNWCGGWDSNLGFELRCAARLFGLRSTNSPMLCLTIAVRFEGAYVSVSKGTKN
jgi:hypothetical protein